MTRPARNGGSVIRGLVEVTNAAQQASVRHRPPGTMLRRLAVLPVVLLVRGYQLLVRPFLVGHCKFHPTCSEFALEALQEHGLLRGTGLAVRRVLRCHPFGPGGIDPVPPPRIPRPPDRRG